MGKRWLLLSSWVQLDRQKKRQLNELFALNRRVMKAYLLKKSFCRLWDYIYEVGNDALPRKLDRPVALAAAEAYGKAGPNVGETPGRNPELLSDQGANGSGRGGQRKHQSVTTPRSWLQQPELCDAVIGVLLGILAMGFIFDRFCQKARRI